MTSELLLQFVLLLLLPKQPMMAAPQQMHAAAAQDNSRSPHGPLALPCQNCHTVVGWKPIRGVPEFNHNQTRFPLRGLHEGVACTQCHTKPVFTNVGMKCSECHADLHRGQFGASCEQCHTVKGWKVSLQAIQQHQNRFPLVGAHAAVECESCHKGAAVGQFQGLSTACYSCHQSDYQKTSGPPHVASGFPTQCEQCHSANTWFDAKFDHLKFTGYALTGAHLTIGCVSCHAGGRFKGTPANCIECHQRDFQGTSNPNHMQAGFPTTCQTCHSTAAWNPTTFDHNTYTKFPLTGAHVGLTCTSCHTNGRYAGTPTDCASCHIKDYNKTTDPNHAQAGFPTTCQNCHTTASWAGATFDHASTGFALTGAHTTLPCSQCHVNGNYHITDKSCVSCHQKDYNGTTNPNHAQAGFPTTCEQCHNTTSWANATFNHNNTGFPLTGAHTTLPCAQCHINGNYNLTDTSCYSCHQKDYQGTTDPNHVQQGFPTTCEQCHSTSTWGGAIFNHDATGFSLTGAHTMLQCSQCHVNGNYHITDTSCVSCHLKDYQGTTDPNHVQAGIPTTCQECHNTTNWGGASFNHATTGFALTGAHTTLPCSQCHVNGNYMLKDPSCSACHLTQYQQTTDPNHVKAGFPTTCDTCHSTTSWGGAQFDHTKNTTFPLTGAHTSLDCNSCHASGVYKGLATTCVSCHLTNFNQTTNPNHVQAGYPQTCELCHTTTAWQPSTFNHSNGPFPLTGAHTTTPCASCHVNNNYTTIPTDCYSCHKTQYTSTTDPNHIAAGFPTTCQTCHTTVTWAGAVFNHTAFPIYTGTHKQGVWNTCADCHTNSSNYAVFSCITCHQHTQAKTDPQHQGVGGYSYSATSCYSCHPTGSGGG